MSDLRLINIDDDGYVTFSGVDMHRPIKQKELAIQRYVLCLFNTAGTMVDAPYWGGTVLKLFLANRKPSIEDTKKTVSEVITQTQYGLSRTERVIEDDFAITDSSLVSVKRTRERGYDITIRLEFANASDTSVTIPGETNVAI